ncbi:hypothetical protein JCM9534A_17560 [Catenuloplanes indicus JCM 9534]
MAVRKDTSLKHPPTRKTMHPPAGACVSLHRPKRPTSRQAQPARCYASCSTRPASKESHHPTPPIGTRSSEVGINFGFYGRVSTEDQQDPAASRGWQLSRAKTLIEPAGGQIVHEFFDIGPSRSIPWKRRPEAALLAALKDPHRGFDAIVIGEPQRAFYGNQ